MEQNKPLERLDNSYIERAIIGLWMINLENLIVNKVQLAKNFHLQPSEIDRMYMWEYELFMKHLNKTVKDENDRQKDEMDKYHVGDYMKMANPNNMSKMMNPTMPKMSMPSMPSMKM